MDYDRSIHCNPDHEAWADFFLQTWPNCGIDRGTMAGWFANAMMAKHDSMFQRGEVVEADPAPADSGEATERSEHRPEPIRDHTGRQVGAFFPHRNRPELSEALKRAIYDNLCAADNQDVPLEEYPDRIVAVLQAHGAISHPVPAVPSVLESERKAIESAIRFVDERIAPRRCDNEAVSGCWRCKTVYLARTLERLLGEQDNG